MDEFFSIFYKLYTVMENTLGSQIGLLIIYLIAFAFKVALSLVVTKYAFRTTAVTRKSHLLLLLTIIIGATISDLAWIATLSQMLFFPNYHSIFISCLNRFAWALTVLQYQASALFIQKLCNRSHFINKINIPFIFISIIFFLFFCGASVFLFSVGYLAFVQRIQHIWHTYMIFALMPVSLIITFLNIRNKTIPVLLRHQAKLYIIALAIPQLIADFLQLYHFNFSPQYIASSYAFAGISTALLTISAYFCARKIMGLRFLNFTEHVQSDERYEFVDHIKDALDQLSQTTSFKDIISVTQTFFHNAFDIPFTKVRLYLRNCPDSKAVPADEVIITTTDTVLTTGSPEIIEFIKHNKVLIYDEIVFTNFYEENPVRTTVIKFLEHIHSDIFIPIYKENTVIAYIIVDRHARGATRFYSDVERDEMSIYCQYLSNVIHLIQHRSFSQLLENERLLQSQLHFKQQELNQLQEGLRSLVHRARNREIGILFYRNRRLIATNEAVEQLMGINLNTNPHHPLGKKLRETAAVVESTLQPKIESLVIPSKGQIVAHFSMSTTHRQVLIALYYADACDIIKERIEQVKDPSLWDYILYLETTRSGHLINQLIPTSTPTLLAFKIEMLKAALSSRALLLCVPEKDLLAAVESIHHVGMREKLHILKAESKDTLSIGIKLFGINPLLKQHDEYKEPSILETLSNLDTLFIQNVHNLDIVSQEHLVELIKYGSYRLLKSDFKRTNGVRIICSSTKNLSQLVTEGKFSEALYQELRSTSLITPSLDGLPESELKALAYGFINNNNKVNGSATSLVEALNFHDETEKTPVSFVEFKSKVESLIRKKNHHRDHYSETIISSHTDPSMDQSLETARKLGKYALRDHMLMATLWNTFQNQNKIAQFLGIHRASVCRWYKKYHHKLEVDSSTVHATE